MRSCIRKGEASENEVAVGGQRKKKGVYCPVTSDLNAQKLHSKVVESDTAEDWDDD